jgi:hypothetical protein
MIIFLKIYSNLSSLYNKVESYFAGELKSNNKKEIRKLKNLFIFSVFHMIVVLILFLYEIVNFFDLIISGEIQEDLYIGVVTWVF